MEAVVTNINERKRINGRHPVVRLGGITVANFNSPHDFKFVGGHTLPACDSSWANESKMDIQELETLHSKGWTDISLTIHLTETVKAALDALEARSDVDIILVPYIVCYALKDRYGSVGKCRYVRSIDRTTGRLHADRFFK